MELLIVSKSDRLVIADPKALQHVCQTQGTNFLKPVIRRELGRMFLGRGIAWAQGEDHKRHRKIMTPAFRNVESRSMMPLFRDAAKKMCSIWTDEISSRGIEGEAQIDVANWLSRATLDALGEVAFGYQFNTLVDGENQLAKSYHSLLVDAFGLPSRGKVFAQQMIAYLPISFFKVLEKLPSRSLMRLRAVAVEGNRVAQELVNSKKEALAAGGDILGTDILSLLVKANASEVSECRLSDDELWAQMRTIMVAGHETTGNSISFLFYELASHPEIQDKVRSEIYHTMKIAQERGESNLSMADMDGMQYTLAVLKEALRFHPVVYGPFLEAAQNDVIPLAIPVKTISGEITSEIPVGIGQIIHLSIAGYNRLADIWGSDAQEFYPERWLDNSRVIQSPFGIYSNLGNFISGAQSCLGWRFAVIEIQTFVIEVLQNFKLTCSSENPRILRATSGVMAPVVEGALDEGKQLPLSLSLLI